MHVLHNTKNISKTLTDTLSYSLIANAENCWPLPVLVSVHYNWRSRFLEHPLPSTFLAYYTLFPCLETTLPKYAWSYLLHVVDSRGRSTIEFENALFTQDKYPSLYLGRVLKFLVIKVRCTTQLNPLGATEQYLPLLSIIRNNKIPTLINS